MKNESRSYLHSSSFKMAMLFTVLLCLSAGVLGYFSYYFNKGHYIEGASAIIDTEVQYLIAADGRGDLARSVDWAGTREGKIYLLVDNDKKQLAGNLGRFPDKPKILTEGTLIFEQDAKNYAAKIHMFPDGRMLLTGMDITEAANSYQVMQWLSFLSILLMAIVILVSFLISTFVVGRTNHIAMTAKSIMDTGDLSKRITVNARWDDLSHMAYVLNSFLERLDELMAGIRRVSDNVAHDLRTPLTRLLNNLESLRDQPNIATDEKSLEHCELMIVEAHGLLSTFNALLRIANIETGKQRQYFSALDLAPIVSDVIEFYEPLAETKNISIRKNIIALPYVGDKDLLFQAFANLLDNAVKFCLPGGTIDISLREDNKHKIFTISDNGTGISAGDREKIFDRFYRADSSRSTEGNGLGLSLVAAILSIHGASIEIEDNKPGALFKITL